MLVHLLSSLQKEAGTACVSVFVESQDSLEILSSIARTRRWPFCCVGSDRTWASPGCNKNLTWALRWYSTFYSVSSLHSAPMFLFVILIKGMNSPLPIATVGHLIFYDRCTNLLVIFYSFHRKVTKYRKLCKVVNGLPYPPKRLCISFRNPAINNTAAVSFWIAA